MTCLVNMYIKLESDIGFIEIYCNVVRSEPVYYTILIANRIEYLLCYNSIASSLQLHRCYIYITHIHTLLYKYHTLLFIICYIDYEKSIIKP